MRASIAGASLLSVVLLVLSDGASGHPLGPLPCPPKGQRVIAHDHEVRVYGAPKPKGPGSPTLACLVGHRTRMTLVPGVPEHQALEVRPEYLGAVVLSGPIVAYVVDQRTGIDTSTSELVVDDLATRRTLREASAGHSVDAGFVFEESLTSLVVTPQGSVAWIEQGGRRGHAAAASVYAAPPTGRAIRLEKGPAIDPESLALSHGTLSWSDGGMRKTTEMP